MVVCQEAHHQPVQPASAIPEVLPRDTSPVTGINRGKVDRYRQRPIVAVVRGVVRKKVGERLELCGARQNLARISAYFALCLKTVIRTKTQYKIIITH